MGTDSYPAQDVSVSDCELKHGYDTKVHIWPKEAQSFSDKNRKKETDRAVTVYCPTHNISWSQSFKTKGLSGQQIREAQDKAFHQCFRVVRAECNKQNAQEEKSQKSE